LTKPNFFCVTKRCWRTGFGKKIAAQFHQYVKTKFVTYAKFVNSNLPNLCNVCQMPFSEEGINFFTKELGEKKLAKILMKSNSGWKISVQPEYVLQDQEGKRSR
jgi:hypothetical protein